MKRTGFGPPTPEQLRRAQDRKQASAKRYQAKRQEDARLAPRERKPRKRIRPVNRERLSRRREVQYGPAGFLDWLHSLGCSVPSCGAADIEAAHATSRGAGGTWEDLLPLCTRHHRMQHDKGVKSFERYVGFSLEDVAASVHQRWRAFAGETEWPVENNGLPGEST